MSAGPSSPDSAPTGADLVRTAWPLVARITSSMFLVTAMLSSAALVVISIFILPRYAQMFADMDAGALPLISRICASPILLALVLVLAAAGIAKEFLVKDPRMRLLLNLIHFVATQVVVVMTIFGLYLPIITLPGSI